MADSGGGAIGEDVPAVLVGALREAVCRDLLDLLSRRGIHAAAQAYRGVATRRLVEPGGRPLRQDVAAVLVRPPGEGVRGLLPRADVVGVVAAEDEARGAAGRLAEACDVHCLGSAARKQDTRVPARRLWEPRGRSRGVDGRPVLLLVLCEGRLRVVRAQDDGRRTANLPANGGRLVGRQIGDALGVQADGRIAARGLAQPRSGAAWGLQERGRPLAAEDDGRRAAHGAPRRAGRGHLRAGGLDAARRLGEPRRRVRRLDREAPLLLAQAEDLLAIVAPKDDAGGAPDRTPRRYNQTLQVRSAIAGKAD
mmetsp:Transcript_12510/g.35656  ORF Transcript_12510/g.35656 Transcript_12510/m.35656 type:complete len:309 (-) Transcript_12510:1084-2010(-)